MDSYKFINATAAWVRETTRTFLAPESVCREVFSVGEDKVPTISRDETSDESSWRNSSVAWIPSGKLERKLRKVRWSTYNMTVNVTDTDANRTVLVDLARANMSDGIDRTAVEEKFTKFSGKRRDARKKRGIQPIFERILSKIVFEMQN